MLTSLMFLTFLIGQVFVGQSSSSPGDAAQSAAAAGYVAGKKFDSKRDPADDLRAATAQAQRTGKRILVDVGGDWCMYCLEMDQLFQQHRELSELRDDNFIVMLVYYGSENRNEAFLSRYGKPRAIPHVYVLDKHGALLHSQGLADLRADGRYIPDKMRAFLLAWAEKKSGTTSDGH